MSDLYKVVVEVNSREDFYEAQARFFTVIWGETVKTEPETIYSGPCPSRSKERAISYALTELAVKLSAGR